jgi:hypothetical protein
VHVNGTRTGDQPKLRHDPGCGHFEWGDGTVLGSPELATEEQMRALRACKACIDTRRTPRGASRHESKDGRPGLICATCSQMMPLTGVCDRCA